MALVANRRSVMTLFSSASCPESHRVRVVLAGRTGRAPKKLRARSKKLTKKLRVARAGRGRVYVIRVRGRRSYAVAKRSTVRTKKRAVRAMRRAGL